jgi:catechol 2,3-dioxygenase-like lactoylglutathione lyase family enzyme
MLGQFLEFSLSAEPLGRAFEFYRLLGFQPVTVGDQLEHAYVALSDGGVTIGLHSRPQDGPQLTFVRPQLRDYARALRRAGIELEHAALADDEFNRLVFADPSGQRIALLEARTFAPAEWNLHNVRACGEFLEYSLPTHSLERSRAFWETFGFAAVAEGVAPQPWLRLAGRGLVIGLHQAGFRAGLSFQSDQLDARLEYLRAQGVDSKTGAPVAERGLQSATLTCPDGSSIYLLESASASGRE